MSNTVITQILSRASTPKLTDPAPEGKALELILQAGLSAPDHGLLRPWHFIVVQGKARQALGKVFAKAALAADPTLSPDQLERLQQMPLRAPLIIIAIARVKPEAKIPAIEQIISTAAAVQNMQLAIHALNFACMWRTGALAYNQQLKTALNLNQDDQIIAFLYIGTAAEARIKPAPAALSQHLEYWPNA